ncbi:hypothetical protein [Streptomyces sp. NRRL B-24085]|uniref:hypothetical protein n=1 Tax=Streptomyces sp. NRRL B-24085 TaxID=1709476 RepID=UPI0006B31F95|nr:hypothetical protein [Streptomyces sp. NRRL B-24085]
MSVLVPPDELGAPTRLTRQKNQDTPPALLNPSPCPSVAAAPLAAPLETARVQAIPPLVTAVLHAIEELRTPGTNLPAGNHDALPPPPLT